LPFEISPAAPGKKFAEDRAKTAPRRAATDGKSVMPRKHKLAEHKPLGDFNGLGL
jgi:hypothetical protein